jgi:tRNA(Ile)-lysidine synthase
MPWPGTCVAPEACIKISASVQDFDIQQFREKRPIRAALDPETLPPVLIVRSRRPGDCYGGPGHRKVKKLLIDAHIPLRARAGIPMVVAREAVVWIPGFAPAKSFRPRPGSRRCVLLECEPLRADD